MKKPVRYHGFVHTLPTKTKEEKARVTKYLNQLKKKGWDNTELWDLGPTTLTSFIYPRLKAFVEIEPTIHAIDKEFKGDMEKALRAFEIVYKSECEECEFKPGSKEWKEWETNMRGLTGLKTCPAEIKIREEYEEGMKAFGRIYLALWL